MGYIIQKIYKADVLLEMSVDTDGYNFLVLYGSHVNGGWCAIPNHGISCEMSDPNDICFNAEALIYRGLTVKAARGIAAAILEAAYKLGVK